MRDTVESTIRPKTEKDMHLSIQTHIVWWSYAGWKDAAARPMRTVTCLIIPSTSKMKDVKTVFNTLHTTGRVNRGAHVCSPKLYCRNTMSAEIEHSYPVNYKSSLRLTKI
jgi:hypothetical protein